MASCYSGEHIASDSIHTDIKTCNRSNALKRSVIDYWGQIKHVVRDTNPRPLLLQGFKTFGPHGGFLIYQ